MLAPRIVIAEICRSALAAFAESKQRAREAPRTSSCRSPRHLAPPRGDAPSRLRSRSRCLNSESFRLASSCHNPPRCSSQWPARNAEAGWSQRSARAKWLRRVGRCRRRDPSIAARREASGSRALREARSPEFRAVIRTPRGGAKSRQQAYRVRVPGTKYWVLPGIPSARLEPFARHEPASRPYAARTGNSRRLRSITPPPSTRSPS
jgi:hypothetical protein